MNERLAHERPTGEVWASFLDPWRNLWRPEALYLEERPERAVLRGPLARDGDAESSA